MPDSAPKTIGRYNVVRLLGAGGMGSVYLAEDPMLKRRLAIKVVHAAAGQQEVLIRFRREAEVSAKLNHPNVITIYDVGEDPAVGPFIAMEFIDGASLADQIHENVPRNSEDRLRVLIGAMEAIDTAHAAGIVHRDIKPGNLMVARDGRVKLMDFGIARSGDSSNLTAAGAVIGTPSYLAPEQLKGTEPSEATDRYAFSVLAFELFTGTKPYVGATTSTLLYNIAHEPPVFPPSLKPPIRKVFEKAFAKDPAERYPRLVTFLEALTSASVPDRAEREQLLALLGAHESAEPSTEGSEPIEPTQPIGSGGAGEAPTSRLAVPSISVGSSLQGLLVFGAAGLAVVVAAAVAAYLWRAGSEPTGETIAAKPPAAARPTGIEETATVPTRAATAVPPIPSPPPPTVAASPLPSPTAIEPQALASASSAEPPFDTTTHPKPSLRERRDAVVKAMRDHDLAHVSVRVTDDHHVVLANLRDTAEAEHARQLAVRATDGEFPVDTALRPIVREPAHVNEKRAPVRAAADERAAEPPAAAPDWQIHREGSERTD